MALPTPVPPFLTTCLPVSYSVSTSMTYYTIRHQAVYSPTIFTVTTTPVTNDQTTIKTTCLTFSPGETIGPELSFIGLPGLTDHNDESMETVTKRLTPGGAFAVFDKTLNVTTRTTTRNLSHIYTYQAETDVDLSSLPARRDSNTCEDVSPLAWASLILTFIAVQLSWWLICRSCGRRPLETASLEASGAS